MDQQKHSSGPGGARWGRRVAKSAVALGILGATGLAVTSLYDRAGAGISAGIAEPAPVDAAPAQLEPGYAETRRFAGRLEPARSTALAFERAGRVTEVLVREGDTLAAGALVARLDVAALANARARLMAARDAQAAIVELARLTDTRQAGLTDRAVSAQRRDETRLQLVQAEAQLAETGAQLEGNAIDLAKSELRAPFAGRVAARTIDEGATVDPDAPVVELMETGAPRARIGLAPEVAAQLRLGEPHTLDVGGESLAARLIALRPDLDPASRTVTALFELDPMADLAFGDVVTFAARRWHDMPGYWVPLTALTEGSRGVWSLFVLGDDPGSARVVREAVRVVTVEGERAFVTGTLPAGTAVIRDGTHRVIAGQAIRVAAPE